MDSPSQQQQHRILTLIGVVFVGINLLFNGVSDPLQNQKQKDDRFNEEESLNTLDYNESFQRLTDKAEAPSSFPQNEAHDHSDSRYQLKVPFYVYEDPAINWQNATINGEPYVPPEPQGSGADGKHVDDYWFLQAALQHPMRTRDPRQAKLFFVPALMNAVLQLIAQPRHRRGQFCTQQGTVCFAMKTWGKHFQLLQDALGESEYFQRSNGTDHVLVASHWQGMLRRGLKDFPNLNKCNLLTFEDYVPASATKYDRIRIPSLYIGKKCEHQAKTGDLAMIASIPAADDPRANAEKLRHFKVRRDICEWLNATDSKLKYSVLNCGRGAQCPALAQAKFGFHVRGDTWGSNRLMDTILSRTVPLFTHEKQMDVVPNFFPWQEISYMVNTSSKASFEESMAEVLLHPDEYEAKLRRIDELMYLFDHKKPFQFDMYMAEFARRLDFQS